MEFKIEKNVPGETKRPGYKYPFGEMVVGDSFAFPSDLFVKITSASSYHAKRDGTKFSVRRDGDGYRVWRIA